MANLAIQAGTIGPHPAKGTILAVSKASQTLVSLCTHMNIYIYMYMHMHMYASVCTYVCMYVYMYACMYIYIYIYITGLPFGLGLEMLRFGFCILGSRLSKNILTGFGPVCRNSVRDHGRFGLPFLLYKGRTGQG